MNADKQNKIRSLLVGSPLGACAVFLLIYAAMSFPLFLRINSFIPGFFSTDESYAVLWNAWRIKFSLLNHTPVSFTDFIVYPFGMKLAPTGFIFYWINFILAVLTTPVLTYNLQVLTNFLLNFLFVYLLAGYVLKDRVSAFFSGLVFGVCPYLFVRSWQHLGETCLWPLPLIIWSALRLRTDKSLRVKLWFISGLVLSTLNFNAAYYTVVILAVFILYLAFSWKANLRYILTIIGLGLVSLVFFIPQFFQVIMKLLSADKGIASAHNLYYRPFADLFAQSAKLLSYFLPAAAHPVFGNFTSQFVGTPFYGESFTEHTLYLGWLPLVLAFLAFRRWRRKEAADKNERFYSGFFIFLALAAWLFSQAPWWNVGPLKIYMPSFFMYKVLPMFRAYCRFGIVVMLAVAILAGFGLKAILAGSKGAKKRFFIAALFCAGLLFEFWNYPPFKVIDVSKVPAVYYWLKAQPADTVIAEYPLDLVGPSDLYKLYQTTHEKRFINSTVPGSYPHRIAASIARLSDPRTAGVLKWLGVKYVLVHQKDYLDTELTENKQELEKIPQARGLKLIGYFPAQDCPAKATMCVERSGPVQVYEVTAARLAPEVSE